MLLAGIDLVDLNLMACSREIYLFIYYLPLNGLLLKPAAYVGMGFILYDKLLKSMHAFNT